MQYSYDHETDKLTIRSAEEEPDFGEQRENIITHFDKQNKPVEIEILDASKTVLRIMEAMVNCEREA